jgi:endonuclease YncB( thermonuclease family)
MMRNAQPIKDTDAYGTPMRKLIRYMPDVALWMIQEKLTKVVGGENQKLYQEIYDYEFYEDMHLVKQWCNDKWG